MNNIVDLSCFCNKTLTVKISANKTINIPKPTQGVILKILSLEKIKNTNEISDEEVLSFVDEIVFAVLNSNTQFIKFTTDDVQSIPLEAKLALIEAYNKFALELVNDPN